MKKILLYTLAVFIIGVTSVQATPVMWDLTSNILKPIQNAWTSEVKVPYLTATSTTQTNTFPLLTTNTATATTICLTGDNCRTTWPTGGTGSNWTIESGGLRTSTTTDYAKASYFVATNTTATSTFAGNVAVTGTTTTTNLSVTSVFNFLGDTITNIATWFQSYLDNGYNVVFGNATTTSLVVTGNTTLGTTTASMLNGVIVVDGVTYPQTGAGIQSALDAARDRGNGECVSLPPGTYTNSTSTLLYSRSCLIGSGATSTILLGTGNVPTLRTVKQGTSKNYYNDIRISGFTVKSTYNGSGAHLTRLNNIDGLSVTNMRFEFPVTPVSGTPESLYVEHAQNVFIDNNYLVNLAGNGIQVNGVDYFTISNNIISSSTDDAIDVDFDFIDTDTVPSRFGAVVGNTIYKVTGGNGIRVENSQQVTVTGNSVSNVTCGSCAGIIVNSVLSTDPAVKDVVVSGNQIFDIAGKGIHISGSYTTNTLVSGNNIASTSVNAGSDARGGIVVASASTTVVGNTIRGVEKTNGDSGGIVIYRVNDVHISNNNISSSTKGINLWNEGFTNDYAGIYANGNTFDNVTSPYYGAGSAWYKPNVFMSGIITSAGGTSPRFSLQNISPLALFTVGSSTLNKITAGQYYNSAFISGALEVDGPSYLDSGATVVGTTTTDVLTTTGNVGIGTASPASGNDLAIETAGNTIYLNETDQTDPAGTYTIDGNGDNLSFYRGTLGVSASEIMRLRNGNFYFQGFELRTTSGGSFASGVTKAAFRHDTNSYLDNGFNFGIGTTTPVSKLSVVGTTTMDRTEITSSLWLLGDYITNTLTWFDTKIEALTSVVLQGIWDFSGATVKQHTYSSFTWPSTATTTSATTTLPLGTAYTAESWSGVDCWVSSSTGAFIFTDGTNRMNGATATTTPARTTLSTNNTFTAQEKRYVEIGPLTEAQISCTVDKIVNN